MSSPSKPNPIDHGSPTIPCGVPGPETVPMVTTSREYIHLLDHRCELADQLLLAARDVLAFPADGEKKQKLYDAMVAYEKSR